MIEKYMIDSSVWIQYFKDKHFEFIRKHFDLKLHRSGVGAGKVRKRI